MQFLEEKYQIFENALLLEKTETHIRATEKGREILDTTILKAVQSLK